MSTSVSTMAVECLLAVTGAATQAASQPAEVDVGPLGGAIVLAAMAAGVVVFVLIRAWDPSRVSGPIRYPLDRPATGPVLLGALAAGVYLGTQVLAGVLLVALKMQAGKPFDVSALTPGDFAMIATVPGIIATIILLLLPAFSKGLGRQLGMTVGQMPGGWMFGLIGAVVAVPLVFASSALFEFLYRKLNYVHPQEHELLAMMKTADSFLVRLALIAGAVIVAPLVEELVFRGFIQSALVRLFCWRRYDPQITPPSVPMPPAAPTDGAPLPPFVPAVPPAPVVPYPTPYTVPYAPPYTASIPYAPSNPPTALARWLAIVLTSLAFAALHPAWSWPMIFLLSLCLGYAYERTGNLWSSITIHLLFNATSTAVFLSLRM